MLNLIAVFVGGGLGSILRYLTSLFYTKCFQATFPMATLWVNMIGAFIFGVFMAYFYSKNMDILPQYRAAIAIGFCGGLTTFSTFSFEVFEMFKRGEPLVAVGYAFLSVFICVTMTTVGFYWAKSYV